MNKSIYVMFCICMFFCGCMTTTPSGCMTTTPSGYMTTQSTTQSFINVQRKDNSELFKIGTIVHYSGVQTVFCVEQVLNNESFELDNDSNTYYVSQMVLVHAHAYDGYMSAWIIPSEGGVYSCGQSIVKGYYKYLGNKTYKTVCKNPDGSPIYNTIRVFCAVDEPIVDTK